MAGPCSAAARSPRTASSSTWRTDPAYRVGKVSLGAVRDFKIADHLSLGVGGLFAVNFVPDGLAPAYGGHNPTGAMGFVRLKLD